LYTGDQEQDMEDVDFLIMSAGNGSRLGGPVRKQWLPVGGLPLFLYTAERLRQYGASSLIVVIHPEDVKATEDAIAALTQPERYRVVVGGQDRQSSVQAGLNIARRDLVGVHDAARPFLQYGDLQAVLAAARSTGAATLGHPARDSLITVNDQRLVQGVLPRQHVWHVQTPQTARRKWLLDAHERARVEGWAATDDSALLLQAGYPVTVVRGAIGNVKITEPEDIQKLLQLTMRGSEDSCKP